MATVITSVSMESFSIFFLEVGVKLRRSEWDDSGESVAGVFVAVRIIMCAIVTMCAAFLPGRGNAQPLPAEPTAVTVAPAWRFTPEINVTESSTDNAALVPAVNAQKSWVTESAPGIRIEHTGVRSKVFLDFRLRDFHYSGNAQLNNSQRLLNSNASVEAIDNWLFVDASANITQQNRSAFSIGAAPNTGGPNGNRVETTTNQISPNIRGRFGDVAIYQLRVAGTDIRTDDAVLPNTKGSQWTGFIKNEHAVSGFGWSVVGDALAFRNLTVGKSQDSRVRGAISYEISSQFHISAITGREVTNYAGSKNDGSNTSGIGLEWSPGERTQFAAVKEKRFFGDSHSVNFNHRTALTAWKITSTRDVSALSSQLAASGPGSTAGLLSDLLVSAIPDPAARDAAVRQRLENSGVPGDSALSGGFATARPFLIRNDEASVALQGVNNTVTLTFSRRDQRGLGPTAGSTDSFSLSNEIRQQGTNLSWIHRLSTYSTLSLVATSLRSEGLSTTNLDSNQRVLNLLFSTRVGVNTYATFGARRIQFDNSLNTGYRENAVLGSISVRY